MRLVSFDPVLAATLLLAAGLYVRALRVLRGRRLHVAGWQQTAWWIGWALLAIGLLGPPDAYDDRVLTAHMAQHLLIGDVAAPFLLLGVRSPLLLFYLPRDALVLLARRRWLRRAFRVLRRPLVALPLYVLTVYLWHWSTLFEGALRHSGVHALQHMSFMAVNLLLWWPVIEPQRRRMGGQLWKIGYLFAARMSTMFLGMVFLFARGVVYAGVYGRGLREGIGAYADQQAAGGMMMTLDIVIMTVTACWFFWLASAEHDASGAYVPDRRQPAEPRPAAAPAPPPAAEPPAARSRAAI
jgi:cytochrome c oxidase assembly factor CtaG